MGLVIREGSSTVLSSIQASLALGLYDTVDPMIFDVSDRQIKMTLADPTD